MTISASNYKSVIDDLKVTTASRYQPKGDDTYCNYFANDVMNDYGYPLPGDDGPCKDIFDGLYNNVDENWKSVDYSDAQSRANSGYPTIGITSGNADNSPDSSMPEHIVVIYPSGGTPSAVKNMDMSMAGRNCYNNAKMSKAWTSADLKKVRFYSYYE